MFQFAKTPATFHFISIFLLCLGPLNHPCPQHITLHSKDMHRVHQAAQNYVLKKSVTQCLGQQVRSGHHQLLKLSHLRLLLRGDDEAFFSSTYSVNLTLGP